MAVEAPGQSNSLGGNLEELDKDQLLQYGAIGGGVILVLLLVVVLAKATKRSSRGARPAKTVHVPVAIDVPEEDSVEVPALDEDLDDFFSDLEDDSKSDEFDDLFDDL